MMRATCVMGSIRIDRRAHASFDASFLSRRLPRAATVVLARSSRRSVRDLWRVSFNNTAGGRSGRLEKSVSRFFSRKRIDPRGTDRSRRPPAQSADGSRHSSARAATAAHTERSRLFGEREARPHTPTDAWGLRIDRRAHASRRLPRAATMVRARSSPRHRLFRHIATARPTGSSEPTPSPIAPRDASSARIGFDRVGHHESASAPCAPRPPPHRVSTRID